MKRYRILLFSVILQMCLGATYSWSVYVAPLKEATGLLQGTVQFPFSLFYVCFPLSMIVSGKWLLPRFGPRLCAGIGGFLFGCGWLLAGCGRFSFLLTVLGIGLVGGMGAGLAYFVPIQVCVQWFPRHKGLVTGIAVAGFGGGAALVSQAGGRLLAASGYSPFDVLGMLGGVFLILGAISGAFLVSPASRPGTSMPPLRMREIFRSRMFRVLYACMLAGLAAGFVVNANLKEFCPETAARVGVLAVSAFAVANALGRILWGWMADRSRPATALQLNLAFQAVVLLSAIPLLNASWSLVGFAFLSGFNYGGVLVLYAATTTRLWSTEQAGQVYPLLFSSNIPAAMFPMLAGFSFDLLGDLRTAIGILAVLVLAAAMTLRSNSEMVTR